MLKIVKKHDKRFIKAQIARTMVPTMLSMAFLQMKGITRIWDGMVEKGEAYGLQPLEVGFASSQRRHTEHPVMSHR